jgi:hypothetical protein
VGFLYRLTYVDGEDAGDAELPDRSVSVGDEIRLDNNELVRVTKVVPVAVEAREPLRIAHELLATIGMEAFASALAEN